MLRNICEQFEVNVEYKDKDQLSPINSYELLLENIQYWIENEDYRSLSQTILFSEIEYNYVLFYTDCLHIIENMKIISNFKKNSLIRSFTFSLKVPVSPKVILLSKIMELCTRIKDIKQSKSKYLLIDENELIPICETIVTNNYDKSFIKTYNCLKNAYICGINDSKQLCLFKLVRNKYCENNLKKIGSENPYLLKDAWYYHWEYHASFSPIWLQRIKEHGGYVDYTIKKVIFNEEENNDGFDEFYSKYNYEPDEQTIEVQNKAIGSIENYYDWKWFQQKYNKNNGGIFTPYDEELEELVISLI
jgi:hypothetical protein